MRTEKHYYAVKIDQSGRKMMAGDSCIIHLKTDSGALKRARKILHSDNVNVYRFSNIYNLKTYIKVN